MITMNYLNKLCAENVSFYPSVMKPAREFCASLQGVAGKLEPPHLQTTLHRRVAFLWIYDFGCMMQENRNWALRILSLIVMRLYKCLDCGHSSSGRSAPAEELAQLKGWKGMARRGIADRVRWCRAVSRELKAGQGGGSQGLRRGKGVRCVGFDKIPPVIGQNIYCFPAF